MLLFILGLIALIAGAEMLVRGASKLALSLGISPLVVGLTVVAFGTSAPEMAVTVQSAWTGRSDIALGSVVGSNILNLLFILGVSALIVPLEVHRQIIHQEVPVMIGASLLLWAMAADGGISRLEGLVLVCMIIGYAYFVIRQSRREAASIKLERVEEIASESNGWDAHLGVQVLLSLAGLGLLVLGANWLVKAAVAFALYLGVSELIIGLTVVAIGTSLPEIATSIMAAMRGERDIAVGNVVGSNIFNILSVLGLSASVVPEGLGVSPSVLAFDIPVMVAAALVCLPVFINGSGISRWEGALLLALYMSYTLYLILHATGHDALRGYSIVMGAFVLPMLAVTLVVLAARHGRSSTRH